MKANIHPQYFESATVICSCGNKFTTGSTQEIIHVELCSKCHPFYTGEQRFIDSASRIQKFQQKQQTAAQKPYVSKKTKLAANKQKTSSTPKTLREMLLEVSE